MLGQSNQICVLRLRFYLESMTIQINNVRNVLPCPEMSQCKAPPTLLCASYPNRQLRQPESHTSSAKDRGKEGDSWCTDSKEQSIAPPYLLRQSAQNSSLWIQYRWPRWGRGCCRYSNFRSTEDSWLQLINRPKLMS